MVGIASQTRGIKLFSGDAFYLFSKRRSTTYLRFAYCFLAQIMRFYLRYITIVPTCGFKKKPCDSRVIFIIPYLTHNIVYVYGPNFISIYTVICLCTQSMVLGHLQTHCRSHTCSLQSLEWIWRTHIHKKQKDKEKFLIQNNTSTFRITDLCLIFDRSWKFHQNPLTRFQ